MRATGQRWPEARRSGKAEEAGAVRRIAAALLHRNVGSIWSRPTDAAVFTLQKYSVNPNGWLSGPTRRLARDCRIHTCQSNSCAKASRRSLPVHLVAKDGLRDAGFRQAASPGRRRTASPARPAACLSWPARMAHGAVRCSGWASSEAEYGALGSARWPGRCLRATGISPIGLADPDAGRARPGRSAAITSRATARKPATAHPLRTAEGRRRGAVERLAARRLPGPRPHQHADQRHGSGRAGGSRAARRSAQGRRSR